MTSHYHQAILLLADGTVFKGRSLGKIGTKTGEICFNTGLTGYQEIYTDPSYFGQILVHTYVHIGNYGAADQEVESDSIKISGMVCRNFADHFSRKMADKSLHDYFIENDLAAIDGIDTRALVQHIRENGAMNAIMSSEILDVAVLQDKLKEVPSMKGLELSSFVTTDTFYSYGSDQAKYRVAVMDFGVKKNILRCLEDRDMYCGVFPSHATFEDIKAFHPDGVMLSNGPGDPEMMDAAVQQVQQIQEAGIPIFGICLGHQILGRANGMKTFKMHNGHRGMNHPVKNLVTGLSEITSQNHGFSLVNEPNPDVLVTHMNLNDQTIEGIQVKNKPSFSVQYHPESSPGPHDSRYLFDDFTSLMNQFKDH
jgi:carbamoyl-phosphate synthase small subunit